jgi:RNA polymerase sigma factor (sigma-70 family)
VPDADADRFTRLYEANYRRVVGYALRRAPAEVAREVADESFLIAWRRLPEVPEPALPWLLVTARNLLGDHHRSGRRADVLLVEAVGIAAEPDPSEAVVERSVVLQAVGALPAADREALVLTVWDGLSNRDAASVAGCSIGTFAVRLHRARRRLRAQLDRIDNSGGATLPPARMEAG